MKHDKPVRIDAIVISTQHSEKVTLEQIEKRHEGICNKGSNSYRVIR